MTISSTIQKFFKDFEASSNNFDALKSAQQFSDVFLHADAEGVQAVLKAAFIASLDKRKAFFDTLGLQRTELSVMDEIQLNDMYTLAKVAVRMYFHVQDSQRIVDQTASYILKINADGPVIVFYLNDQMLTDVLKEHGILND